MQKNIVETARDAGTFTTLIAAIDRAGLESTLAGEGPFTVFAPSAEAFARLLRTFADAERGRWARELHDETLQALGGLRLLLASAVRRRDPAANEQAMRQAIEDIEQEIDNLRAIITDLRPSLLDDLGLLPALRSMVADFAERRGVNVMLEAPDSLPVLSDEAEVALFRALQEALSNVARHAGNAPTNVAIHATGNEVILRVADHGPGFGGEASLARLESEGHLGLAGMRERITALGGEVRVASSPGAGVVIVIRIPVSEGSSA